MVKVIIGVLAVAACAVFICACASKDSSEEIKTAKGVDLEKYMGKWFEIARYENWFQKGLLNSEAQYSMEDGKVLVVNSARTADGSIKIAKGKAYAPNPSDPSKLRVSFFWPFYSDYYILELADDYSWVLVGSSSKEYLWILSRSEFMDKAQLDKVLSLAEARGYDTSKLLYSEKQQKKVRQ